MRADSRVGRLVGALARIDERSAPSVRGAVPRASRSGRLIGALARGSAGQQERHSAGASVSQFDDRQKDDYRQDFIENQVGGRSGEPSREILVIPDFRRGSRAAGGSRLSAHLLRAALILVLIVAVPLVMRSQLDKSGENSSRASHPTPVPSGKGSAHGPGFSLAVPNGWTRSQVNNNTFWTAPDRNTFIQIDTTPWSGSSNQQAFRAEADVKRRHDAFENYHQKRIEDLIYQGQPATDWEFTFTGTNKQKIHAQERFVRLLGRTYAIYFRAPDSAWASSADTIDLLYRTFRASG
jgi:hypothetical protein